MIKLNVDFYIIIFNLINFILPLYCFYRCAEVMSFINSKNKFEKYYIISIGISCVFYLILLYRFSILETVDWGLDFIFWSIFEAMIFILFIVRICYVKQCNRRKIK